MEENNMRQERKDKICGFISNGEYIPLKRKEMRKILQVPEADREVFDGLIEELLKEGRIIETKKGKLMSPEKLQMGTGSFIGHARGFGFVRPDEGETDIFIPASETGGAMQKDRVLYKVLNQSNGDKKADGTIVRILERGVQRVVGTYEQKKGFGFVVADDKKIAKDIFISPNNGRGAVTGHKVVVEIIDYGNERMNPAGKITEILGHVNDPGVDILSIIYRYELEVEFPDEVYAQIEHIGESIDQEEAKTREDLRDMMTVTIDGEDAKDLDDAISLIMLPNGNYQLWVHIADVSHYVEENSPLDKDAYGRGTSVYLVDRVIPMLPHRLSNGICSLNPDVERLAMSCMMEINNQGNVVDHRLMESVIRSNYRMTYTGVSEILEDETSPLRQEYAEIVPLIQQMDQLREILGDKREKRGSINFDLPESKIVLDENGHTVDIYPYERSSATNLIEEFMLICNETIAENAFWQEIPFMYRTHMEPDEEKLEKMVLFIRGFGYRIKKKDDAVHPREMQRILQEAEGKDEEKIITRIVLRSMMQARYGGENLGHFGLAAKYYCHFTSPIRRYPDLMIHRMLKVMLRGGWTDDKAARYKDHMPEMAAYCSRRERVAEEAERDTNQLKKVEYMEDKIGETFDGIISGVTGWGIYVELPNTIEGMIALSEMDDDYYEFDQQKMQVVGKKTKKVHRLGDKVRVTVAKVSKQLGTIDFVLEDEEDEE